MGEDQVDYPEDEHEYQELIPQPDPQKPIELAKLKICIEDMRKEPRSFRSEYEVKVYGLQTWEGTGVVTKLENKMPLLPLTFCFWVRILGLY